MKIKDVMVRDVKTCMAEDCANTAAQLLWENDCGSIVVVSPERHVVGMVTDRDLCMACYTRGLPLTSIRVADVMTYEPKFCRSDDDLLEAASLMRAHQVRRLPVLDDLGNLVGLISLNDLARFAVKERFQPVPHLSLEVVAETLAEVCLPWCRGAHETVFPPPAPPVKAPAGRVPQLI